MKTIWYPTNCTLWDFDAMDKDFFEGIYDNPFLNWSMISIYIVGLVGIFGLALVVWFERSGQAGPYRTLINQLVSYNITQVIKMFYCSTEGWTFHFVNTLLKFRSSDTCAKISF